MTALLHEPELLFAEATVDAVGDAVRPGFAFIPCAVCAAPVDLADAGEPWERPVCDLHAVRRLAVA